MYHLKLVNFQFSWRGAIIIFCVPLRPYTSNVFILRSWEESVVEDQQRRSWSQSTFQSQN